MPYRIPAHLISTLAEVISDSETHAKMDNLFMYANAPGDPPEGNKMVKAQEWLRRINSDPDLDCLEIVGRLIEEYMEPPAGPEAVFGGPSGPNQYQQIRIDKLQASLKRANLTYIKGGRLSHISGTPTRSLSELIAKLDYSSIDEEFDRAVKNIESNPREAVSAACNILESVFKTYIEENGLQMPQKQDLQPVWKVVRDDLNLDPSTLEDRDLKEIISGLFATVNGIGALRTHASSAHGAGTRSYKLKPRHARLAIHAAHTLATFVLETWQERRGGV